MKSKLFVQRVCNFASSRARHKILLRYYARFGGVSCADRKAHNRGVRNNSRPIYLSGWLFSRVVFRQRCIAPTLFWFFLQYGFKDEAISGNARVILTWNQLTAFILQLGFCNNYIHVTTVSLTAVNFVTMKWRHGDVLVSDVTENDETNNALSV
jgi:hypothetical protein